MKMLALRPAGPGRAVIEALDALDVTEYGRFRSVCARTKAQFDRALDGFVLRLQPGTLEAVRGITRTEEFDLVIDAEVEVPAAGFLTPAHLFCCKCPHDKSHHDTGWDASGCMADGCACRVFTPPLPEIKAPVQPLAPSTPRGHAPILVSEPDRKPRLLLDIATKVKPRRKRGAMLPPPHEIRIQRSLDDLRPYQREGRYILRTRVNRGWGLFDDPGLGKTPQALVALPDDPRLVRALVVSPASLKYNWQDEGAGHIDNGVVKPGWRTDLNYSVVNGGKQFRWPEPGEVVIINYDILPTEIHNPPPNVFLIADEAHALKSGKTLRTKLFKKLHRALKVRGGTTWLLTGTEMLNRPNELWSLLSCADLAEEAFGSWPRFCDLFGGKMGVYKDAEGKTHKTGYKWGAVHSSVPERLRQVSIKRMKKDVLKDLPGKTHKWINVDIDDETARICDEVVSHLKAKGIDLDDFHQTIELTQMQGAGFQEMSRACAALALAKVPAMLEVVEQYEEQGEPLVVFAAHRGPIDVLAMRDGWARISGSESHMERQEIARAFQRGEYKGIAGLFTTMGTGYTLTHGAHMLMVELDWSPLIVKQAEDRLCRYGQLRGVLINILKANHRLDARRLEITLEKMELIEATTEAAAVPEGYLASHLTS